MSQKEHLSLVVCGHVDAGKSTTTGHLIFKLGGISARDMEKLQQEADEQNKSSFAYAFYMDSQKEERERGVTIQCNTKEFFTETKHFSIVDAPGHRDYVKNMISGAAQADVGLLLVPAEAGGFETAIARGDHKTGQVQGQTRQHARLLSLLGVEQIIVGINKMDSCNWSQERFEEIKTEMLKMLQQIGFKPKKIPVIPYSGYLGENLIEPTDKMPWFNGWKANLNKDTTVEGVTLVECLEKFAKTPARDTRGTMRMPVSGVLKIKGVGDVITGRIERGILRPNDVVGFTPSGTGNCKIFSIEMHHKSYEQALPGDNVGLNVKGLDKSNMPKAGDIMYIEKEGVCKQVAKFTAQIAVQEHPGQLKTGFAPIVHVRTAKSACKMSKIIWKSNKASNHTQIESPAYIESGDAALVEFEPTVPLFIEQYDACPGLGRFAVMNSNQLVMLGKALTVEYKED
uniref:Elongation factor Tu GTP binding domain protein n=1 Tax=Megaviridae environmental sample TaxID=1737588 RepID=A0A5J6VHS0_9VIRU|nr:MAG: elongation factor Tu GTP binding domain protein [Megaviridae environmental sample]